MSQLPWTLFWQIVMLVVVTCISISLIVDSWRGK
jgi:hypothetical protein